MHAYYITCTGIKKNSNGDIVSIHCTYDPKTKGGWSQDGRKVRGTIHWVCAQKAIDAQIKIYNKLFNQINPFDLTNGDAFIQNINDQSLVTISGAKLEDSLASSSNNISYQFVRKGYYKLDVESSKNNIIFNQIVDLKDKWNKKNN